MTKAFYEFASKGNGLSEMKRNESREHLKAISNTLLEMAKAAGRKKFSINQLLRETYNLVDVELDTYDGWKSRGSNVRKGQRAYLFWGEPITNAAGVRYCPVNYLFASEQVVAQAV